MIFKGDKNENSRQHTLVHFYRSLECSFLYLCRDYSLHNNYRNTAWQAMLQACKARFYAVWEKCAYKFFISSHSKYIVDNFLRLGNGTRIYINRYYLVYNNYRNTVWQAVLQACEAELYSFRRKGLKIFYKIKKRCVCIAFIYV